jgi:hypothetical protein
MKFLPLSRKTNRQNSLDILVQKGSRHQTALYFPQRGVVCVKAFTAAVCGDVSGGQPCEDEVSIVLETCLHNHDDATCT